MRTNKPELVEKLTKLIENNKIYSRDGVLDLLDLYEDATDKEQVMFRSRIDDRIAGLLMDFSFDMAVECVREKSIDKLSKGLLAQVIEDSRSDFRDNLIRLFLLRNSAKILHVDFLSLVRRTQKISSIKFAELLNDFVNRKDLDSDLEKLSGYRTVTEPEFNYVWAS